jgi:hypothetical protein
VTINVPGVQAILVSAACLIPTAGAAPRAHQLPILVLQSTRADAVANTGRTP